MNGDTRILFLCCCFVADAWLFCFDGSDGWNTSQCSHFFENIFLEYLTGIIINAVNQRFCQHAVCFTFFNLWWTLQLCIFICTSFLRQPMPRSMRTFTERIRKHLCILHFCFVAACIYADEWIEFCFVLFLFFFRLLLFNVVSFECTSMLKNI